MPYKPVSRVESERKKQNIRDYDKHRPERHKFYNSSEWKKLRDYVRRKNPLCAECLRNGIITEGDLVDHIVPIEEGGAKLDISNLQVLCNSCHNKKHGAEKSR